MEALLIYGDIVAVFAAVACVIYLLIARLNQDRTTNALGTLLASLVWIFVRIVERP